MAEGRDLETRAVGGIRVSCRGSADEADAREQITSLFAGHALHDSLRWEVSTTSDSRSDLTCCLPAEVAERLAPSHDTLKLADRLEVPAGTDGVKLALETVAALLLGPHPSLFPSPAELRSALRIRANIVRAARLTMLAFDTRAVERPLDCWAHDYETGFTIRPAVSLIEALRKATQPGVSGTLYSFSCYRATEYVFLLALAEELAEVNSGLYQALERLWQRRAIVSGEFHDVFLRETGSLADPLPMRYCVPGDRVWFRNPDEASADASGYEGSWVFYLGGGEFSNFWKRGEPFGFDAKCLEVYHWRHAIVLDAEGELRIDEAKVAECVAESRREPAETKRILARMQRYRDPRGVYAEGGCIDCTREQARWVCPGTSDLVLPAS